MARNFDGTNDYLDAGNPSALNLTGDEVTVSAWVRLDTTDGEGKILAKWSDAAQEFQYLLSTNSDEKCLFAIYDGGTHVALGATTLVANTWYHLAGVYDGTELRAYLDGVEEGSTANTGNMIAFDIPVRIGAGSGGSGTETPFDGDIGHCAIWDTPLSGEEVASLAAGISPLKIQKDNSLLFYAPVNGQDPEYDVIGQVNLTVNGSVKSEEPPIPNSIVAP